MFDCVSIFQLNYEMNRVLFVCVYFCSWYVLWVMGAKNVTIRIEIVVHSPSYSNIRALQLFWIRTPTVHWNFC